MKIINRLFSSFLLLSASFAAQADVLVLVHGFMGSPYSWQSSGVLPQLAATGWQPAGIVSASGQQRFAATSGKNPLYLAALSSEAPIPVQVQELTTILHHLQKQHPDESIRIAGQDRKSVV